MPASAKKHLQLEPRDQHAAVGSWSAPAPWPVRYEQEEQEEQEEQDAHLKALENHLAHRRTSAGAAEFTDAEQVCVNAGALNYQVENGGFAQWILNGFDKRAGDTHLALLAIGAHAADHLLERALLVAREAEERVRACDDSRREEVDAWEYAQMRDLDDAYEGLQPPTLVLIVRYARAQTRTNPQAFPGLQLGR
jgi:hypothetical protein